MAKIIKGKVISDKMDKTIVVAVNRMKIHTLYRKKFRVTKKYKVHDEKNQFKVGDEIYFSETRPLSKEKRWVTVEKDNKSDKEIKQKRNKDTKNIKTKKEKKRNDSTADYVKSSR